MEVKSISIMLYKGIEFDMPYRANTYLCWLVGVEDTNVGHECVTYINSEHWVFLF